MSDDAQEAHDEKAESPSGATAWPAPVEELVKVAIEQTPALRQWVAIGDTSTEEMAKRVTEAASQTTNQARAEAVEAEQQLTALKNEESLRLVKPRRIWLLPLLAGLAGVLLAATTLILVIEEQIGAAPFVTGAYALLAWIAALGGYPLLKRRHDSRVIRPYVRSLEEAEEKYEAATASLRGVLLNDVVVPTLFLMANENRGDLFRTHLSTVEHEGLAELDSSRVPVNTEANVRLESLLQEMPGGSIGLAGPRGAGKSTLIRAACPIARVGPIFGVVVAAPVEFQPREFVLHLFAELCRRVLGDERVEDLRRGDSSSDPRLQRTMRRSLTLVAGVAAVGAATYLAVSGLQGTTTQTIALVGATDAGVIGLGLIFWEFRRRNEQPAQGSALELLQSDDSEAVRLAARRLGDIWFQQTYTKGWSGSLAVPVGVTASLQGTTALARQQMSMPDIVGEMRRLINVIADKETVVRIGIDELDKIESPKAAARFMNEIKVLFGIENCFFLVSVSEDAMSAFERRGLPFRDVFDSSFDDIVRVGHLRSQGATELIQARVIGMPIPFILLGYTTAGGLARDLIRVSRDMIGINAAKTSGSTLSEVCLRLVQDDVEGKAEATIVACRLLPGGPIVERLQSWLRSVGAAPATSDSLLAICTTAPSALSFLMGAEVNGKNGQSATRLAAEFLAFCYFAATLLEFFTDERAAASYEAVAAPVNGRSPIDRLAVARQAFAIHPRAAWEALTDFRQEQQLGATPPFPAFAAALPAAS